MRKTKSEVCCWAEVSKCNSMSSFQGRALYLRERKCWMKRKKERGPRTLKISEDGNCWFRFQGPLLLAATSFFFFFLLIICSYIVSTWPIRSHMSVACESHVILSLSFRWWISIGCLGSFVQGRRALLIVPLCVIIHFFLLLV